MTKLCAIVLDFQEELRYFIKNDNFSTHCRRATGATEAVEHLATGIGRGHGHRYCNAQSHRERQTYPGIADAAALGGRLGAETGIVTETTVIFFNQNENGAGLHQRYSRSSPE